jgi:hypothetical protein
VKILAFKIEPSVAIKIFGKHSVLMEEIEDALIKDRPVFRKAGGGQYCAIALSRSRYITIFFTYDEKTKEAEIATAYPSSKSDIRHYKRQLK